MNIYIPKTTQVPNIIFDEYMAELSGSELKVLLFFIRQRFGFQRWEGVFSYSITQICKGIYRDGVQVCKGTGLSNRSVLNCIKTLEEKNLIRSQAGNFKNKESNKYELVCGEKSSSSLSEKISPSLGEESSSTSVKKVHSQETKRNQERNQEENSAFFNMDIADFTLKRFEEIWKEYPNKLGKKEAFKHFKASVKSEGDYVAIQRALKNYKAHLAANTWKNPQHAKTWFNNWTDWIDYSEPVKEKEVSIFGSTGGNQ